jgi:DNA replication protein DnaC
MEHRLLQLLETLSLKGVASVLERELVRSEREASTISEVLERLLEEEYIHRQEKSLAYRIRQAKLPWDWSLESFPFQRQPGVNQRQIRQLASLDFIKRSENIVFIGRPGTGKTGLAISLLRQSLLNQFRGRFYNAQELMDDLYASLADRSTSSLLKKLAAFDLLVIDELGYLTLKPEQANAFFKLMDLRYGKKATIITTNLDFPDWYTLFQHKPLVDALLDRLQHRCTTIRIDGPSLRNRASSTKKKSPDNTKN